MYMNSRHLAWLGAGYQHVLHSPVCKELHFY